MSYVKVDRRLYIIRSLKWILSNEELVVMYNAIITALFLYASPTYGNLPITLLCKFERFTKRAHRLICGCDCKCNNLTPICDLFLRQGLSFLKSCEVNSAHPLHCYVSKRFPRSNHLMIAFCATSRRLNSFSPYYCVTDMPSHNE